MSEAHVNNPTELGFDGEAIEDAWLSLVQAADRHEFGGAVALIARHGKVALHRATGWAVREPEADRSPMGVDTIFDLASLTKVTATTPSILKLVAEGAFGLDTPVRDLLPVMRDAGLAPSITVRHLMSHSAGLIAWLPVFLTDSGPEAYLRGIVRDGAARAPGERVVYSDPSFITLGEIVREVSGMSVADHAREHIFCPLGMAETMYTPPRAQRYRIAATERGNDFEAAKAPDQSPAIGPWRTHMLRGEVHDGNAWYGLNGVAGHAGLFGTAIDLFRYGQMWLNGGVLDDVRVLPEDLIAEATREQIEDDGERRGVGWRLVPTNGGNGTDSALGIGQRGYGHTGFTGTSLWMDPDTGVVIVLLTNRVHPTVTMDYMTTRARVTQQVMGAVK